MTNPIFILGKGTPDPKDQNLQTAPTGSIYFDSTDIASLVPDKGSRIFYHMTDPDSTIAANAEAGDIWKNTPTGNEFQLNANMESWDLIYCPFALPNKN